MRRPDHVGVHTKVTIGPDGTQGETPWDVQCGIDEHYGRWDIRDNLTLDSGTASEKRRRKEFTYFMIACARAYADEKLSPSYPPAAAQWLRREVKRAGGTLQWITYNPDRVRFTHENIKCGAACSRIRWRLLAITPHRY